MEFFLKVETILKKTVLTLDDADHLGTCIIKSPRHYHLEKMIM